MFRIVAEDTWTAPRRAMTSDATGSPVWMYSRTTVARMRPEHGLRSVAMVVDTSSPVVRVLSCFHYTDFRQPRTGLPQRRSTATVHREKGCRQPPEQTRAATAGAVSHSDRLYKRWFHRHTP